MRYLKQQVLNRRAPSDARLYVDVNDNVLMSTPAALQLPTGTTSQRPIIGNSYGEDVPTLSGMIRYNSETNQLEGYQAGVWRAFRFKEPTQITQQELGNGDAVETFFGPLNPAPVTDVQDNITWDNAQIAKNLFVIVENVIQLSVTNYVVVQNPCRVSGNVISFDSGTKTITSSNTSLVNFLTKGFRSDQQIVVTGTSSNNSTYTIDTVTSSTIVLVDAITTEAAGSTVSIVGKQFNTGTQFAAGYYISFTSEVPYGKPVTVLHGFDK